MISFAPGRLGAGVRAGVAGPPFSLRSEGAGDRLAAALGIESASLYRVHQVHGANVVRVPPPDTGQADGLICEKTGHYLCLSIADCCAVLVHDPVRRAVGAFHAGWRGARDGIVARGVEAMAGAFGTEAGDLAVYLSPCASGDRYVVGPEVAAHFPRSTRRRPDGSLTLDLAGELALQLVDLGVPRDSIEASGVCTLADARCHSHRRDGPAAGRMAAFIGLL